MKVLITGAAGFIGFHLVKKMIQNSCDVLGLDNLNFYYDINLKLDRLRQTGILFCREKEIVKSTKYANYSFVKADISDKQFLNKLFKEQKIDLVINLAAQAGVRYSITNPDEYATSNLMGFFNILESCRDNSCTKLIYASSSSVYGNTSNIPFREEDIVDRPASLYAATKRSNELMASTYSDLYGLNAIGLRFFTVYGPWGRPDMAPMLFANAILNSTPIKVFNKGDLFRDFTYVDDIVNGINAIVQHIDDLNKSCIYNIGCGQPVNLMDFIALLETNFGSPAIKEYVGMQLGDVRITYADTTKLYRDFGYKPVIDLETGISAFSKWYKNYYTK